jgi:hypothetical protein
VGEAGPRNCFEADPSGKGHLYGAWKDWCAKQGDKPGAHNTFGRNLGAAFPQIRVLRDRKARTRYYVGIELLDDDE